jgi:hypothetical protein
MINGVKVSINDAHLCIYIIHTYVLIGSLFISPNLTFFSFCRTVEGIVRYNRKICIVIFNNQLCLGPQSRDEVGKNYFDESRNAKKFFT